MAKGYPKNGKSNKGWIKKGERKSPDTEFKKGVRSSPKTEFKKGQAFWQGKKRPPFSKKWRENIGKGLKNHPIYKSKKRSQKLSKAFKGEKSHFWKGGISPQNELERKSARYKRWRERVFKRDNYTCRKCGRKGYLHAHHIKPFAKYPKLRFKVSNGRTLCRECHKK